MNEQALKDRIKQIAKVENKTFQEVWKLITLERFLARLSSSRYQDNFIFKGGMLLSYYLPINRETTDVDFLAKKLKAEISTLRQILIEICDTNTDDGFAFTFSNISELDHNHMNYPGYRAKAKITFGGMHDSIQIDIGVGDAVEAKKLTIHQSEYNNKPIFDKPIELSVYPVETIFSEKLETVVNRGAANSRMKDFHDLYLLCQDDKLIDLNRLIIDIRNTFKNRNTEFKIPILFIDNELEKLQTYWTGHLRTLDNSTEAFFSLPKNISDVIDKLNIYLENMLAK